VTRDVAARVRGFLASVMLEAAPGVYVAPRLNRAVRERVMDVLVEWQGELGGAITLLWQDGTAAGGLAVRSFGAPARELVELDGLFVSRTDLDAKEREKLVTAHRSLKIKEAAEGTADAQQGPDLDFPPRPA